MIYIVAVVAMLVGFFLGVIFLTLDDSVIRLKDDEVVVKRPDDGLMLVAVTPHIARRLINKGPENNL